MRFSDRKYVPYTGDKPYIFLSYSHNDAGAARELIGELIHTGFRVWYDEGLISGPEWDEAIAAKIRKCSCMIALISENYIKSQSCRDEIEYARDLDRPCLLVYLQDVNLTDGMAMRFGCLQALYKDSDGDRIYEKIAAAEGIGICRETSADKIASERAASSSKPETTKAAAGTGNGNPRNAASRKPSGGSPAAPEFLAIEPVSDCIRWGAGFKDRRITKTIPLSETVLSQLPAHDRAGTLAADTLTYIRDREGFNLPGVCVFTVPYLTCRDLAQIESVSTRLGIRECRVIKRVSSMAMTVMLNETGSESGRGDCFLLIDYTGMACETAIAQIGSGIVEMLSVVGRQAAWDTTITAGLLLKDVFKAIDASGVNKIASIYVSGALPAEHRDALKNAFHSECVQLGKDSVLNGAMLQGSIASGIVKDVVLLDTTDYEICVMQTVVIQDGTTIPCKATAEITCHTARRDRCIDVYIRKNNMTLDQPSHIKLPVHQLLLPNRNEQKLLVTAYIDCNGRIPFTVECPQTGMKIEYGWEKISEMLME